MILSFHPCFVGSCNLLCAGRSPGAEELASIRQAEAIVLPQGCNRPLWQMARIYGGPVFPNYDARFLYHGKTGQARLFAKLGLSHPPTLVFEDLNAYRRCTATGRAIERIGFPLVFKFDWGGEGETVFRLDSQADLQRMLQRAAAYEASGQRGFLLQAYISSGNRCLRVVVIGHTYRAYWRIQRNPLHFGTHLCAGATIAYDLDAALISSGIGYVQRICSLTGINLAGFDLLFTEDRQHIRPLILEINYYFGRQGLGGSQAYYELLIDAIESWLRSLS